VNIVSLSSDQLFPIDIPSRPLRDNTRRVYTLLRRFICLSYSKARGKSGESGGTRTSTSSAEGNFSLDRFLGSSDLHQQLRSSRSASGRQCVFPQRWRHEMDKGRNATDLNAYCKEKHTKVAINTSILGLRCSLSYLNEASHLCRA